MKRTYTSRKPADERRASILEAALRVARKKGVNTLVRNIVAEEAGVCSSLLNRYFDSMDSMRAIVIDMAFEREDMDVLYKSITIKDFKKLNKNPALIDKLCTYLRG